VVAESFGAALRRARADCKVSLATLSRLVHYSPGYLSRVERGERLPSPALAQACDLALGAGGALAELVSADRLPRRRAAYVTPAQLPASVAGFTGRDHELAELDAAAGGSAVAVVISAIGGMAGVGKTALAVHFAHQVAGQFPDGQLYVNLRGFDPSGVALDPAAAIRGFLDALQVPAARIPPNPEGQAGLFRSILAGRRMLILADNARDATQVRPLLPGAPGCLVLVTSRNQLAGLAASEGARLIGLGPLSETDARALLAVRISEFRVAAEPAAVAQIIRACGRLPLALAIVAARSAARPELLLSDLAAELSDRRLDALANHDDPATDARAVFSWSYRALSPAAARVFRLLGLHPGPDFTAPAVASLAALTAGQAQALLTELSDAHLLGRSVPGRFVMHDLLRAYALELTGAVDTAEQRQAAVRRVLDHYLRTSKTGAERQDPLRDPITLGPPQPGVSPEALADADKVLEWFTAEHAVLLAAVRLAARDGLDDCTWQLAWAIWMYLYRQGHWYDLAAAQQLAVAAARRAGNPRAEARAHRGLADACEKLGRLDEARAHRDGALALYRQAGDQIGEARTYEDLAILLGQQQRHHEALDYAWQAADLFKAAGNQRKRAHALNTACWYLSQLGDFEQALVVGTEALAELQALGDPYYEAHTWDSLGYAHRHLGQHDQAADCYQHAVRLIRQSGEPWSEAAYLTRLGDTYHAAGRHDSAHTEWQQALAILDNLGHPDAVQVRAKLAALPSQAGMR
jgi:tetratricopeptide (TPR) repeat protein/transcriptional regulator with XRE-family HTH domain